MDGENLEIVEEAQQVQELRSHPALKPDKAEPKALQEIDSGQHVRT